MRAAGPPPDDGPRGEAGFPSGAPGLVCDLPGSNLWLREDSDGAFTVGLSLESARRAGTVAYYRAPQVGARVRNEEPIASLETSKWVGHVPAPADGSIVATNDALEQTPGLIVEDPTGAGWLYRIRADDPAALRGRLSARPPPDRRST